MGFYVSRRFIAALHWDDRLQISCWQLIGRMEKLTIFRVLHGEEMQRYQQVSRWGTRFRYLAGYKDGSMIRKLRMEW